MPLKGQSLSEEAIRKMVESKKEQIASQYNWIITEPYLDVVIQNGSSNRKTKFITLREFRQNIISNISVKEMINQGISRHVLQFFSNFCQGKIKLTKDDFVQCYEKGESLDEICNKYKVTRDDLTYLRQLYGIKRKGATFINRKQTEEPITERQRGIIYGCWMGDGRRQTTQSFASISIDQCDRQKDYVLWKYLELQNLATSRGVIFEPPREDGREEYENSTGRWGFYTKANTDVEKIGMEFYGSGKKVVTQNILDNLTPLSIAVWFMDDGIGDMKKRVRDKHPDWDISPEVKFCTDSFSKEECELMVVWFKEKYNINCHLREHKPGQNRIIIDSDSVQKLFDLISPHIIPCMRYKIDYKAYLQKMNLQSEK